MTLSGNEDVAGRSDDALVLHADDNVATALRSLGAGHVVVVRQPAGQWQVLLSQPIPACHKFALRALAVGDALIKYGEPIGSASTPIQAGEHVHIHNLHSLRAHPSSMNGEVG